MLHRLAIALSLLALANAFVVLPEKRCRPDAPGRRLFGTTAKRRTGSSPTIPPRRALVLFAADPDDDYFTEDTIEAIADEVKSKISVPFVPPVVVGAVATRAVEKMSTALSDDLLLRLRATVDAESTPDKYDDASSEELDSLTEDIAVELNESIDISFLTEGQEEDLLRRVVRVILYVLTTSGAEFRKRRIKRGLYVSQSLLEGSPESRSKLVDALNAQVDVPFLGEESERALLESMLEKCAEAMQTLLPPEVIEGLKGESPEGLDATKSYLVERIGERANLLTFVSEDKAQWVIQKVVDMVIDELVEDTELELVLMNDQERQVSLEGRRDMILREMELSKKKYDQQQLNLAAKLERIEAKLEELNAE